MQSVDKLLFFLRDLRALRGAINDGALEGKVEHTPN